MYSTIALSESFAACIRSSFTPIVAYQPFSSTSGVSGPGVLNWGAGMCLSLIRSKRNAAYMGLSMPVTQTSPSPCAACASPQEKSAPSCCTGRYRIEPFVMCRVVHVAAEGPRRHDHGLLRAGRADAHGAEEGLYGDDDVVLEVRVVAVGQVEGLEVSVGKILRQEPEAGYDRGPSPTLRADVQNLDRQHVPHLGASHRDGAGQRVEAVPVEARKDAGIE